MSDATRSDRDAHEADVRFGVAALLRVASDLGAEDARAEAHRGELRVEIDEILLAIVRSLDDAARRHDARVVAAAATIDDEVVPLTGGARGGV